MQNPLMVNELRWYVSPASRLADINALLDSYGVSVSQRGLIYLQVPLFMIPMSVASTAPSIREQAFMMSHVDEIQFKLIRFEPNLEERQKINTRWPFYVDNPLEIAFLFRNDRWCVFQFTPGKRYEERESPKAPL